jgi:hypothetical protein
MAVGEQQMERATRTAARITNSTEGQTAGRTVQQEWLGRQACIIGIQPGELKCHPLNLTR